MSTISPMLRSKLITMIYVDLIQVDDYSADSCAISPTAFFFVFVGRLTLMCAMSSLGGQYKENYQNGGYLTNI